MSRPRSIRYTWLLFLTSRWRCVALLFLVAIILNRWWAAMPLAWIWVMVTKKSSDWKATFDSNNITKSN